MPPRLLPFPALHPPRPVSSPLHGISPAFPPSALDPPPALFGQTGLNRGPLFGPVWPNKNRPFVQTSRTKAVRSAKRQKPSVQPNKPNEGRPFGLFGRMMPGRGVPGAGDSRCQGVGRRREPRGTRRGPVPGSRGC